MSDRGKITFGDGWSQSEMDMIREKLEPWVAEGWHSVVHDKWIAEVHTILLKSIPYTQDALEISRAFIRDSKISVLAEGINDVDGFFVSYSRRSER